MLGIGVSVFMIALFPDMKDMLVNNIRDHKQMVVESVEENSPDATIKYIENMSFVMDNYALTYDIKMVLLMLCIGVPLGGIANFYIKYTVGGPLGVLSDFMYEYTNADDDQKLLVGEKVDKIRTFSKDEILVVAESTKAMVHSIEDYIERTKQEQQLEMDLEVAKKASEAKSSFLSNMSHEIRTPINAVLGMNEMILRENNDPQINEYAQNVKSAGNSLLGIVNDILDFSKIEAGKMDILNVEYHLSSMVNDLLNMISVKADDKGLEVIVNVDEKTPDKLFGDEVRIKQCVTNILTNAVKYTEKGTVTLNVGFREAEDDDN
ncbi:MAG: hybrid sensor histidine kinase/response regulator, partial [Butyrivibrio sp.]|nr:hybrid sensor histidine kinase/response regulator [Butyrivibrio sp.]